MNLPSTQARIVAAWLDGLRWRLDWKAEAVALKLVRHLVRAQGKAKGKGAR